MTQAVEKKKKCMAALAPFQFKPGQSGNKNGRPKGIPDKPRTILKKVLNEKGYAAAIEKMRDLGIDIKDGTHADLVVAVLLWKAEMGDLEAIKEVFKQVEKPLMRDLFDPDAPLVEEDQIKVTLNVVKSTTNIQNNITKQVINVKPKKIKLKR